MEGGEALEQVVQRSCGCSIPGGVQGQVGQGSGHPDLVGGIPAYGRGYGTRWSLRSTGEVQAGYQEEVLHREGWLHTGTGSPGTWSRHQACQSLRSVCTVLLVIRSEFLGRPVWSQELDSMVLVGPFQLGIFSDST